MKAKVDDRIKTTVDVPGFVIKGIIPKGTEGVIIEAYNQLTEIRPLLEKNEGFSLDWCRKYPSIN